MQILRGITLERKGHLDQRRVSGAASGLKLFHQFFKRQILVLLGFEGGLPNAREQVTKRRVAGEVGVQGERVDEEPDQPLGFQPVPAGNRRADDEMGLARGAVQQNLERRQQRDEQRDPFGLAELLK